LPNVAGLENGRVASTTNMTSACRSLEPLLDTCMGTSAPWPVSDLPLVMRIVPCGVRMLCSPAST
jgi:hypothetical protein